MNSSTCPSSRLAIWLGLLTAPAALFAQQAATPSAAAVPAATQETVILSPFEVTTDKDTGFVASSALAGGRLNLELKDVPAAYSVITRDFIDAVGITNLYDASDWAPNTFRAPDTTGGGDTTNNATIGITVRGVGNIYSLRQRNFFVYFAPMDSYSIERYDFGRGPNQILFGNGTVGGQSVSMTKRARFDKPFETVELSAGSWAKYRGVLDVNRPLGEKFAARLSAVWADRDGWRRNESEYTKAIFGTLSFKPWRKTEIRLEGEIGRQGRRIPYTELFDRFAGWDGVTVFSGRADTLPTDANARGVGRRGSNYFIYDAKGNSNAIVNYQNDPMTFGANQTAQTPVAGLLQVGTQTLNATGTSLLHSTFLPDNRFETAIRNSQFRLPSDDWTMAPTSSNLLSRFKDLLLTASHRFSESAFFEVAGDINRVNNFRDMIENQNMRDTYIDINRLLPNGAANPQFLQPYADAQYRHGINETNAESVRAAFAYVKDLGRWGNYSFNLMSGMTHRVVVSRNSFLITGVLADPTDRRPLGNGGAGIRLRQYWSEPVNQPLPPASIPFVDPVTPANNRTITPFWNNDNQNFNNMNDNNEYYNYALAAMNAKYFNGRLVLLAAVRRDDSKQKVKYPKVAGDFPRDWDGATEYFRPNAPADWRTLTYTPKNAAGQATGTPTLAISRPRVGNNTYNDPQPQYANDHFQDDYNPPDAISKRDTPSVGTVVHATKWLSLSGNYAKAFMFNASAAPDPNSQLMPPAQGDGWDAMTRFSLIRGKLDVSAGYYSNKEFGNYIDPTGLTNNINSLYNANQVGDLSQEGRNIRGGVNMSTVTRDTRTRNANGYEFIVTANPSRAWRITANYSLPKVWNKDFAPITRAYVASHADLFRQILADAGGMVGADGRAVVNPAIPLTTAIDQTNAVNAYNNIYTQLTGFLPDMQLDNYQKIGNAFADYTFQEGRLKGFRLGVGVNYRGRKRIGYRGSDTIVDPANRTATLDDPIVDGHTTVWAPAYSIATVTSAYRWRMKEGRELLFNLRVNNALNDRELIWVGTTLRPRNGDLTSPARETVRSTFAYKVPAELTLTVTLKM